MQTCETKMVNMVSSHRVRIVIVRMLAWRSVKTKTVCIWTNVGWMDGRLSPSRWLLVSETGSPHWPVLSYLTWRTQHWHAYFNPGSLPKPNQVVLLANLWPFHNVKNVRKKVWYDEGHSSLSLLPSDGDTCRFGSHQQSTHRKWECDIVKIQTVPTHLDRESQPVQLGVTSFSARLVNRTPQNLARHPGVVPSVRIR